MTTMRKTMFFRSLAIGGTSGLMLLAATALTNAQDGQAGAGNAAEASAPDAGPKMPDIGEAIGNALRSLPDDMDEISAEEIRRLDEGGVLKRQKDVGEDILIMERELTRAEAINELIEYMGIDGFKSSFPELYGLMKDSPVMLRAEIQQAKLKNDLVEAMNPSDDDEDDDKEEPSTARDDGSGYFNMPTAAPRTESRDRSVDDIARELRKRVGDEEKLLKLLGVDTSAEDEISAHPREPRAAPISLREIYGIGDKFYAIIIHGEERIRVSAGDELPGDTKILSVKTDHIVVRRGDREMNIRIRG